MEEIEGATIKGRSEKTEERDGEESQRKGEVEGEVHMDNKPLGPHHLHHQQASALPPPQAQAHTDNETLTAAVYRSDPIQTDKAFSSLLNSGLYW